MKRISVSLLVAIALFTACKQSTKGKNGVTYSSAVSYNDYIVSRQTDVMKLILKVSKETQTDLSVAEQTLNSMDGVIDKSMTEIEGMPDWKGDTILRNDALALFRFYKSTFGNDYRRIIAIQKDGDVTEAEKAEYEQLVAHISSEEEKLDANFQKAQEHFASQNGIPIQKNDIQDKIDQMGK